MYLNFVNTNCSFGTAFLQASYKTYLLPSSTFCETAGVKWKTVRRNHFLLAQCTGRIKLVT